MSTEQAIEELVNLILSFSVYSYGEDTKIKLRAEVKAILDKFTVQ